MPTRVTSCVKPRNGVPTLFINDKPHSGMALALYAARKDFFQDFTKAGVDLFSIAATPTFSSSCFYLSGPSLKGPGEYDFSQLDERMGMILDANPNAHVFPRLNVGAPPWWLDQHPDDVCMQEMPNGKLERAIEFGNPVPSWASEPYRALVREGLEKLITHVEQSRYAENIIGYHLASGTTEEWMFWGSNDREWTDYSPANKGGFQRWIKQKYKTEAALREAWRHPRVTFEMVEMQSPANRNSAEFGNVRNVLSETPTLDFMEYQSDLTAETICLFAKYVKELTNRTKTVGVFYGYVLQLCGEFRQQNGGHLALNTILNSPDVDFMCSPGSYAYRQQGGEGIAHFMSLHGSVKLHGKLWFDENDYQTSLSGVKLGEAGKPATLAGDKIQQDKVLAHTISHGAAQWWFDVCGNRYNDPTLMGRISELNRIAEKAAMLDRSPVDEVAFVVDPKGALKLKVGEQIGSLGQVWQVGQLRKMGAPVGDYIIDDLDRLMKHKVIYISMLLEPTDQQRKAIEALKSSGRVIIFTHAPGLFRNRVMDDTSMEELTGIRLRLQSKPVHAETTLVAGHPFTMGAVGEKCGTDRLLYPGVLPEDDRAVVLGRNGDGKPSVVVKDCGGWTSVFVTSPALPHRFLHAIVKAAGVHVYVDTPDQVWACRDVVSLCVHQAGERMIRLPRKATVEDADTGEILGKGVDQFAAIFSENQTRIFFLR